jgi:hypothetical protein
MLQRGQTEAHSSTKSGSWAARQSACSQALHLQGLLRVNCWVVRPIHSYRLGKHAPQDGGFLEKSNSPGTCQALANVVGYRLCEGC